MSHVKSDLDAEILAKALAVVSDREVAKAYDDAIIERDTRAMALCSVELEKRKLSH
ncbi:hypothetical protein [Sphingomonas melonis]|jgi:hypothetical protein|uniref:Uncharacterized protein n=1 Tax=Sphingomonas melonis TaxID=152682 RepID=A0A7Y9K4F3_9SPHN|nr:hypothetical protein [Sphingomonas melonis]NYD91325.1 hypothetical protein [Sphingomonas melonis]